MSERMRVRRPFQADQPLRELRVSRFRELSSGRPLDRAATQFLEPRFGHSFEEVRVHSDCYADELARSLGAEAFATGSDIYFRAGEYRPDSPAGRRLLAHEAAHVLQSKTSTSSLGFRISDPDGESEHEAERAADQAMASDGPLAIAADSESSQCAIHRSGDDDSSLGHDLPPFLLALGEAGADEMALEQTRAVLAQQGLWHPSSYPPSGAVAGGPMAAAGVLGVVGGGMEVAEGVHGAMEADSATGAILPGLQIGAGGASLIGGAANLGAAATGGSLAGVLAELGPVGAVLSSGIFGYKAGEAIGEHVIDPYLNRPHTEAVPVDELGREKSYEELEAERKDSWAYKINEWLEEPKTEEVGEEPMWLKEGALQGVAEQAAKAAEVEGNPYAPTVANAEAAAEEEATHQAQESYAPPPPFTTWDEYLAAQGGQ
jgi:hypothetical protein